jgi:NitT/TauT family transport system substrate-binding protein
MPAEEETMNYWGARTFFALVALLGLSFVVACGSGSGDDDSATQSTTVAAATPVPTEEGMEPASLTFQLDWIPNIQHFGPSYADEMGFYKDENLEVNIQPGGQGIDGVALVVGGGADIAVTNATNIYAANEQGADIIGFAAVFQKTPSAVVCRADSGITNFSDVSGKTFGSKGPSDDESLPKIFEANGVTDVKIQPIGASSITEILAGIVDCQLAYAVNEPITMEKAGIKPVIFSLSDLGFGGQGEIYFTRSEYFDAHKDVLVRFLQATAKAWEVYLDDPEAAAEWVVNSGLVDGLDLDQQKAQAVVMADLISNDFTKEHGLFYINDDLWQLNAQQALDSGRITMMPDLDTARSFAVLDEAALSKR